MSNPWDRPPLALTGDQDDEKTYAGVGRIITEWEDVEGALSHLCSLFVGEYLQIDAIRRYGNGGVSSVRITKLADVARIYFQKRANQNIEADFEELIERLLKYSQRRHDVAHGVVRALYDANDNFLYYGVVPAYYNAKHFGQDNIPTYLYARKEMDQIRMAMNRAYFEVISFITALNSSSEDR